MEVFALFEMVRWVEWVGLVGMAENLFDGLVLKWVELGSIGLNWIELG